MVRPRRPETVSDYLFARCEQLNRLGGEVRIRTVMMERGSDAVIEARVRWRSERLTLHVFEHIVPRASGRPHREKYKYLARWRGNQLFRYDRDPLGHPTFPEHKHLSSDRKITWPHKVTLNTVVEEMWDIVEETKRRQQRRTA